MNIFGDRVKLKDGAFYVILRFSWLFIYRLSSKFNMTLVSGLAKDSPQFFHLQSPDSFIISFNSYTDEKFYLQISVIILTCNTLLPPYNTTQ